MAFFKRTPREPMIRVDAHKDIVAGIEADLADMIRQRDALISEVVRLRKQHADRIAPLMAANRQRKEAARAKKAKQAA